MYKMYMFFIEERGTTLSFLKQVKTHGWCHVKYFICQTTPSMDLFNSVDWNYERIPIVQLEW
jgi:hypothetical protein